MAEFSHGVNAKKLKAGDKVKAVLTQALVLKGKIVAPNEIQTRWPCHGGKSKY